MDFNNDEKLNYLFEFVGYWVTDFIDEVLYDSETDPEFSAVTANNIIICYIHFLESNNCNPPQSIYEFFISQGYSEDDFELFKKKRDKESVYYRSKQYNDVKDR